MEHLGRYDLIDELSRGYLGVRWTARVTGTSTEAPFVVMRVIDVGRDPIVRDRLSAAAFWAMEVKVAGNAATTDVVADGDRLGVVSPFRAGETLQTLLARSMRQGIRASGPVALRIVADLLDDLEAVARAAEGESDAEHGVHGGVAPDSVLVGHDGRTQLLDVGVGAVASGFASWNLDPARLAYDVPERCGTSARVGAAADTFALGVLAWELVAGRRLFEGDTVEQVAESLRHRKVPALDEVAPGTDPAVAGLVARALARDPSARMQSAAQFQRAIADAGVAPASRTDVVAFVHGSAGRVSKAIARLSTRPPPPAPPPPLGAIDAPAPLGSGASEEDAPTREMLRPEEETPTREFEIPPAVLDALSAHDEVTEPDATSAAIAESERVRAAADVGAAPTPAEEPAPAPPSTSAVESASPAPVASPAAEPTPSALPSRIPNARPSLVLPFVALAALVLAAIVVALFLGSRSSEPRARPADVPAPSHATPAPTPPPAPTPVEQVAPPVPKAPAAAAPASEAEAAPTPDVTPTPAAEPAPTPAAAPTPEAAPTPAPPASDTPAPVKRKPRPPASKPFVPDDI